MAEIKTSKSILAKLLAAENITVSHQNTKTAYFDLKSRTLVCPIWKEMDGDLYDLLMGHEVGHALETPEQGWHNALDAGDGKKVDQKFKSFLNVIEDARIEKKVKRRFPGLSKPFANAYKGLFERNFFGVKNIDVNKLNLIDRINLRFKLGAYMHVPFNDVERGLVQEVDQAETWDEVEALARRIYGYVKENEQDKLNTQTDIDDLKEEMRKQEKEQNQQETGEEGDSEENSDESYEDAQGMEDGAEADGADEFGEENEDDSDDASAERGEDQENDDSSGGSDSEMQASSEETAQENDDPESITDREFRKREEELVNESGVVHMLYLPEANLKDIIFSNKKVMDSFETFLRRETADPYKPYGRNKISYEAVVQKCINKFNKNNKKFIAHILKEFDMRKKASAYARTQTARTGELNMNVLHKYKFSNDLFKKISVVPKGKNHGMLLFVDLSGSMSSILRNTIEQLLVLASFCRMANIPFEVYGFSDWMRHNFNEKRQCWIQDSKTESWINESGFNLKHLIGSSLSAADYRRSFGILAVIANEYNRHTYGTDSDCGDFDDWSAADFQLGGTPFVETLLASREMIKNFRAAHNLDVTNVVYLTDGEGTGGLRFPLTANWNVKQVIYYIDKKTKKKIRCDSSTNQQAAITDLVRDITNCKHIGYYIGDARSIKMELTGIRWKSERGENKYTTNDIEQMRKSLKENNFFACSNIGYDKYFYATTSSNNIQEEKMEINGDMTKSKMASAFKKSQMSKRSSRLLVSKFAEEIATAL